MGFNRKIRQKTIEKSKVNLVSVVYNRGKKWLKIKILKA